MNENGKQRWDAGQPIFVRDVLRTLIGLWLLGCGISAVLFSQGFVGMLSGGLLGIALYLIALFTRKAFFHDKQYRHIMLALMLQQMLIWVAMAFLLLIVKVHPVTFVLGASLMPFSIIRPCVWYFVQRRRDAIVSEWLQQPTMPMLIAQARPAPEGTHATTTGTPAPSGMHTVTGSQVPAPRTRLPARRRLQERTRSPARRRLQERTRSPVQRQ